MKVGGQNNLPTSVTVLQKNKQPKMILCGLMPGVVTEKLLSNANNVNNV